MLKLSRIASSFKNMISKNNHINAEAINTNYDRLQRVVLFAIPVSLLHIVMFIFYVNPDTREEAVWRLGIIASHTMISILSGFVLIIRFYSDKKNDISLRFKMVVQYTFILLIILIGVAIVAVDQLVTPNITPFLVVCSIIGLVFLLRPLVSVPIYIIGYIVFYIVLGFTQQTEAVIASNRVNGITITSIGLTLSTILWSYYSKDYHQRKQIEEQNKFKSDFLATMSHEIRTPLNAVIGFTELLMCTELNEIQEDYVKSTNNSGRSLLKIVNNILDYSKLEAGKLKLEIIKTDMYKFLADCIDVIKTSAFHKGVEVILDIDPTLPRYAMVDPTRLAQILSNLLSNAVKFTFEGQVTLSASFFELGTDRGKIRLAVKDTGIGIPDEQRERLFKAFSQGDSSTTRVFGGTGLGLVISSNLAMLMDSQIQFESKVDLGTEFFFEISVLVSRDDQNALNNLKGKTGLIIESNDGVYRVLKRDLSSMGISTKVRYSNFLEADEAIKTLEKVDLILCAFPQTDIKSIEGVIMLGKHIDAKILLMIDPSKALSNHVIFKERGSVIPLMKPVKLHELSSILDDIFS